MKTILHILITSTLVWLLTGCTNLAYVSPDGEKFSYTTIMQDASKEEVTAPNGITLTRTTVDNKPVTQSVDRLARLATMKAVLGLGGEVVEETADALTD